MTPVTDVLIGGHESDHVIIRPLTRTHPSLFDRRAADAIDCEIEIAVGGFRGQFRADLRSEEFAIFLEAVQGLTLAPDASARFVTSEGQVMLSLTGDGEGRIRVTGDAIDAIGGGNRLQFGFELPDASLAPLIESLQHLLSAFPVTDGPVL